MGGFDLALDMLRTCERNILWRLPSHYGLSIDNTTTESLLLAMTPAMERNMMAERASFLARVLKMEIANVESLGTERCGDHGRDHGRPAGTLA